jgi:pyrroloquinoline quinone biosynthesis protein B
VDVILLGTAAGGGFPQWNCWCPTCRVGRADPTRAHPRTQSSIAVRASGGGWFLFNASPDVREQLARLPGAREAPGPDTVRRVSIEGVVLTDAELDHTLGIVLLRESRLLTIYATDLVEEILLQDSRVLPTTRAFAEVRVERLALDRAVPLRDRSDRESGLTVEAFAVAGDPPRFAADRGDRLGHTVGLLVREPATGTTLAFVPGAGALDARLAARLRGADLILFDGTCWTDDELVVLGISQSRARDMGHLAMHGPGGSLEGLRALAGSRRVYTHINNSNPVLVEDSPERRAVEAEGIVVGDDGMSFTLERRTERGER